MVAQASISSKRNRLPGLRDFFTGAVVPTVRPVPAKAQPLPAPLAADVDEPGPDPSGRS